MKKRLRIRCDESKISLKTIESIDCEKLRDWKNRNKNSFFYKENITMKMQREWFEAYNTRPDDYMFMVIYESAVIGCMGFRIKGDIIDLYNIIRGVPGVARGAMSEAMRIMLNYIVNSYKHNVQCDVLEDNDAVEWYKKCGFHVNKMECGYYVMGISKKDIDYRSLKIEQY